MCSLNAASVSAAKLRWRAEESARAKVAALEQTLEVLSPQEARKALHELYVHQIELEMQNEELRRVQQELDAARARYFDLYNLAPVGYCIVSPEGLILEANLTAVALLGETLATLVKQPVVRFVFKDDQDIYYLHRKHFLETGELRACELRMARRDGTVFWAQLMGVPSRDSSADTGQDEGGKAVSRIVLSDITERKRLEEENARLAAQLQRMQKLPASSSRTR